MWAQRQLQHLILTRNILGIPSTFKILHLSQSNFILLDLIVSVCWKLLQCWFCHLAQTLALQVLPLSVASRRTDDSADWLRTGPWPLHTTVRLESIAFQQGPLGSTVQPHESITAFHPSTHPPPSWFLPGFLLVSTAGSGFFVKYRWCLPHIIKLCFLFFFFCFFFLSCSLPTGVESCGGAVTCFSLCSCLASGSSQGLPLRA